LRAATSAGLSRPVCVTVREGTGAGAAFGRDGVFPRPRRERGAPLGVERRWVAPADVVPGATSTFSAGDDTAGSGGTELASEPEPAVAAAGASEPERPPTV
jgi:hypothetical protein